MGFRLRATQRCTGQAREGEEPNLEEALHAVRRAANYDHITIADVWTDIEKTDINIMITVSNAAKGTGDRFTQMTSNQLRTIARVAKLEKVKQCWMSSTWKLRGLKDMNVPQI
jgi:hypothetical protein